MLDYFTLGSSPINEGCIQVSGDVDYYLLMKFECNVFRRQLQRMFPAMDLKVRRFEHDFGSYLEVVVYYEENDEDEALKIEDNLPEYWDHEAKIELYGNEEWVKYYG